MSASPSVSVVIPVLDGAATIGDTLTGLMNQAPGPLAAEILVVDNGSTDDTRAIVEKFPVELLSETKPGPAAARNRGLHAARGAVVAHLDADTLPTRRWLAEIAAPFADPAVTQVAGRMLSYRPSTPAERYYAQYFLDREEENASADGFPVRRRRQHGGSARCRARRRRMERGVSSRPGRRPVLSTAAALRYADPLPAGAVVFVRTSRTLAELKGRAFKYGQGRARSLAAVSGGGGVGPAVGRARGRRAGAVGALAVSARGPRAGPGAPATRTCRQPSVTAPGTGACGGASRAWSGTASGGS